MFLFLKESAGKDYGIAVFDEFYHLVQELYKLEKKNNPQHLFRFLKLFLIILSEKKISKLTFDSCYKSVLELLETIKRREKSLPQTVP